MDIFGENGKASYPASTASNGTIIIYHPSCRRILAELSHVLNKYFSAIELRSFREYWPPNKAQDVQDLSAVRKGLYSRILKNRSLISATANLDPVPGIALPRISIHPQTVRNVTLSALDHIDKPRSVLTGFVFCYCLAERLFDQDDIVCYNPIVGGWIAAAADEGYRDRELKGLFCWNRFPRAAQLELQYAFLLKILIDAAWWSVDDRDKSVESNRFVSIPIEDLVYFPSETLELLNDIGDQVFCQHWEPEHLWIGPHQVTKCPCSKFQSANARSYLLLPARKLRSFLEGLARNANRSQSSSSVLTHILTGRPSQNVVAAIEEARLTLRGRLARRAGASGVKAASPPHPSDLNMSQSLKRTRSPEESFVDLNVFPRMNRSIPQTVPNDRKWARRTGKPPVAGSNPVVVGPPESANKLTVDGNLNDVPLESFGGSSVEKFSEEEEEEELSSSLSSESSDVEEEANDGHSGKDEDKISAKENGWSDGRSSVGSYEEEISPVYMDSPAEANPVENYVNYQPDVAEPKSLTEYGSSNAIRPTDDSITGSLDWDENNNNECHSNENALMNNNGDNGEDEEEEEEQVPGIIDID